MSLTPTQIRALLQELDGSWRLAQGRLCRAWSVPDFATALGWTQAIGALAEAHGHHPDLELGWGYVRLSLWTHDIGGLSELDRRLAVAIDGLGDPQDL